MASAPSSPNVGARRTSPDPGSIPPRRLRCASVSSARSGKSGESSRSSMADNMGRSADEASGSALQQDLTPTFNPAWMPEFVEMHYNPLPVQHLSSVIGIWSLVTAVLYLMREDGNRGGALWALGEWGGRLFAALTSCITYTILNSKGTEIRSFAVRRFDWITGTWCVSTMMGHYWTTAVAERRQGTFHVRVYALHPEKIFANLTYNLVYDDSGLPTMQCHDDNPAKTLLEWGTVDEPGCSSAMVYGSSTVLILCFFMMYSTLNVGPKTSVVCTAVAFVVCLSFSIFAGRSGNNEMLTLSLFLVAGLAEIVRCYLKTAALREEFVALKVRKFASLQKRRLLHTLIPPNVLANMSSKPEDTLCTHIKMVTMMFCAVDYEVSTRSDFDLLAAYLEVLDHEVQRSGMFKYQHVSCGSKHYYIVACPRAACPYDATEQEAEYPARLCHSMVHLGGRLKESTANFAYQGQRRQMHLSVGIHCGPAACVVLGKCRRFFCVYGNTVNTASRMASNAGRHSQKSAHY